jgi:hypothetical protein
VRGRSAHGPLMCSHTSSPNSKLWRMHTTMMSFVDCMLIFGAGLS